MFSVLICFSFLIVLISNFAEIQLIVFMINIVIIVSLIRWKWALFNIALGVGLTAILYNHYYVNLDILGNNTSTSQFKIVYLILLTASSLVLFLKPKQQHQELTEDSNLFLSSKAQMVGTCDSGNVVLYPLYFLESRAVDKKVFLLYILTQSLSSHRLQRFLFILNSIPQ